MTKNLVTFKGWDGIKYEKFYDGDSLKNPIFRGDVCKKPMYKGMSKKGSLDSFKGGLGKKEVVFLR